MHPLLAVHVQRVHSPLFHVWLHVRCQSDRVLSLGKQAVVAGPEDIAWLHSIHFAAKSIDMTASALVVARCYAVAASVVVAI